MKMQVLFAACFALTVAFSASEEEASFQKPDAEDPVEYVREVNESLAEWEAPTPEKRLQTIYSVNAEKVRTAKDDVRKAVIAEVFATAPLDALPTIADRFASEFFSRKVLGADAKAQNDVFAEFMAATLMQVRNRVEQLPVEERPGARSVFAVISFLKASDGKPENLRESLMFYILTGSQYLARTEWIPKAMGDDGKEPSYQSILAADEKGEEPPHVIGLRMAPSEMGNLQVGSELRVMNAKDVSSPTPLTSMQGGQNLDTALERVPRIVQDPDSPWYKRRRDEPPGKEPDPYKNGQAL